MKRKSLVIVLAIAMIALLVPVSVSAMTVKESSVTNIHSGNTLYVHAPKNKTVNFCLHADDNDAALVWKVRVYNNPTNYDKTYTIKRTSGANNMNAYVNLPKNSKNRIYGIKITVSKGSMDKSWYTYRAYKPNYGYYSKTCN